MKTTAYNTRARSEKLAVADRKEREELAAIKRHRKEQNTFMRQDGYTWSKEYRDHDEYEEGEPSVWVLHSPDNRAVTVGQALDEIERGADIVQDELAKIIETGNGKLPYDIILSGKLADAKTQREQNTKIAKREYREIWETAKNEVKNTMIEVEQFDYDNFEKIFDRLNHETITTHQAIFHGQINDIDCAVIYKYTGGHDYNETKQYYSVDPLAAGIEKIDRNELEASFHKFFGE